MRIWVPLALLALLIPSFSKAQESSSSGADELLPGLSNVSNNLELFGKAMGCAQLLGGVQADSLAHLLRFAYRGAKCALSLILNWNNLPDELILPGNWGYVSRELKGTGEIIVVGDYFAAQGILTWADRRARGGCISASDPITGTPIYSCESANGRWPEVVIITDALSAYRIKREWGEVPSVSVLPALGDPQAVSREIYSTGLEPSRGLGFIFLGPGQGFRFWVPVYRRGQVNPEGWLWLTVDGPVASMVVMVGQMLAQSAADAAKREKEIE